MFGPFWIARHTRRSLRRCTRPRNTQPTDWRGVWLIPLLPLALVFIASPLVGLIVIGVLGSLLWIGLKLPPETPRSGRR